MSPFNSAQRLVGLMTLAAASLLLTCATQAQTDPMRCKPASERTGEFGCWILSSQKWSGPQPGTQPGTAQQPVFWSLDTFPDLPSAQAAKGPHGQVLSALGKVWVLTLSARNDRPATGTHIAQLGPLPLQPHDIYSVQYMESILPPGTETVVHRHPGIEAFYTEAGEACLETPNGKQVGRNGNGVVVPEGEPMVLVSSGTGNRRGLTLVLHDAAHPWSALAPDWKPKGLCRQ